LPKVGSKESVVFYGKGRWAKLVVPSQFNKWTVEVCLDNESLSKVLELKKQGIKNNLKHDEDGTWITFSRNAEITIQGKMRPNTPPVVVDKDGNPWPRDVAIGNGSDLAVRCNVVSYKVPIINQQGIAVRLEAVKVLHLKEFDNNSFDEKEIKQLGDLQEAEAKPW
jgi:hypothetical protein